MQKLLYKLDEAAEMLSMSKRKLWSLAISGEVPSFKINNGRFFYLESLENWIKEKLSESG